MRRSMANSEPAIDEELQKQIERIQLEYQSVLESYESMAPKDINKRKVNENGTDNVDENELDEIETVSEDIDILNSALDTIEERTDRIRAQLLELLTSNRETRQFIQEENERIRKNSSSEATDAIEDAKNGENSAN